MIGVTKNSVQARVILYYGENIQHPLIFSQNNFREIIFLYQN
ncbi:hypothetical protein HMPREF0880_02866 [Yokenella regensburgei ATCC 43003]|nr:hypothetical protein HMPREF0880_02866 [Yokenella regensburgei ATCC 43003]